ncbi:rhodanese-like domain-containing protein [Pelagibius litoralis]|uniref:Rhodanese-like domain-containing protein n=1 Tax=Pelagibius litoralis TaxID=374515 RepID=A0A967KA06_9PROT|nr:rhodanese-like domain-containing protein [Pelagibius litoralis]NIA70212.1 rhodanese-like domain-containing protein [Pelagibius litoralis]
MRWLISAVVLCLGLAGPAGAAEETPLNLEGVTIVSAQELKPMLEQGIFIYDLRKKASFVDGHVPGAQSAAAYYDAQETTLDTSFLGPNKSDSVLFYSHGTTGWKSYWAAKRAVEAGYTNVMWMRGGFSEWASSEFPIAR